MFETLYQEIYSLSDLKPNPKTNSVFSKLYQSVINGEVGCDFCGEKKHNLQNICSQAEYELEKYYAEKIVRGEIDFNDFPYVHNYKKLVQQEISFIKNFQNSQTNILYIGGGPFPLSAILFAQYTNSQITILDISLEAISLGQSVIQKLGLSHQIKYEFGDANNYVSSQKYDVVSVASLVFTHGNIENILQNLQKLSFQILHLRSADGVRELLYKKIPKNILEKYFQLLFQHHPKDEIINSIILCKKYE